MSDSNAYTGESDRLCSRDQRARLFTEHTKTDVIRLDSTFDSARCMVNGVG